MKHLLKEIELTGHCVVVTTIQPPTASIRAMASAVDAEGGSLIIVADKRSPSVFDVPHAQYLSVASQAELPYELAERLPFNHYSRKNLGYLSAIAQGFGAVFDTDDDNAPLPTWQVRQEQIDATELDSSGWTNAYSLFTDLDIWPRGFPLELLRQPETHKSRANRKRVCAPIQQGLANGSPDVDAVWRLLQDREIEFDVRPSVLLQPGAWCPFNSQSTWWFPTAYPLLYLPSHVSFRMTDIWRSFIAQRCLWELGLGVVFHGPEMFQDRNPHNLLRDFEQEVPGYLGNARLCGVLKDTLLDPQPCAVGDNLRRCYLALVGAGFVPEAELTLVEAWLSDFDLAKRAPGMAEQPRTQK